MEIKNQHFFKNTKQMIIYVFLFLVIISLFIILGSMNYKKATNDHELFHLEYPLVSEKNIYRYTTNKEVYKILNEGSGVILFGFPSNEWVNYYAKYLNEVAISQNIKEILFYDFKLDRINNNGNYELVVNKLENYLKVSDTKKKDIYSHTLVVVKSGKIVYFDDSTSFITGPIEPKNYYTEFEIGLLKSTLKEVLIDYLGV